MTEKNDSAPWVVCGEIIPPLLEKTSQTSQLEMNPLHQEVYRLYFNLGKTQREIARELGISRAAIISIFKEYGWKPRPARPRRAETNPEEVHRLYFEEGLSQREVAEKLGFSSASPVQRIFNENGWKTRGRWGNGATYNRRRFSTEEERKLATKERSNQRQQELKELREHLFGTKCKMCGKSNQEKLLAIHRKDFKEHEQNALWLKNHLEFLNPEEWVPLCIACHRGVHWLRERYNADWSDIEQYLKRKSRMIPQIREPFSPSEKDEPSQKNETIAEEARENIKELRRILFGEKCSLCGNSENRRLVIHRKDGRLHSSQLLVSWKCMIALKPDEWVALCQKCHRYVHWAMDVLGLEWENFDSNSSGEY